MISDHGMLAKRMARKWSSAKQLSACAKKNVVWLHAHCVRCVISTSVNFVHYSKLIFHYATNDDRWMKKEERNVEGAGPKGMEVDLNEPIHLPHSLAHHCTAATVSRSVRCAIGMGLSTLSASVQGVTHPVSN